jgi:hypothetical protein
MSSSTVSTPFAQSRAVSFSGESPSRIESISPPSSSIRNGESNGSDPGAAWRVSSSASLQSTNRAAARPQPQRRSRRDERGNRGCSHASPGRVRSRCAPGNSCNTSFGSPVVRSSRPRPRLTVLYRRSPKDTVRRVLLGIPRHAPARLPAGRLQVAPCVGRTQVAVAVVGVRRDATARAARSAHRSERRPRTGCRCSRSMRPGCAPGS